VTSYEISGEEINSKNGVVVLERWSTKALLGRNPSAKSRQSFIFTWWCDEEGGNDEECGNRQSLSSSELGFCRVGGLQGLSSSEVGVCRVCVLFTYLSH